MAKLGSKGHEGKYLYQWKEESWNKIAKLAVRLNASQGSELTKAGMEVVHSVSSVLSPF